MKKKKKHVTTEPRDFIQVIIVVLVFREITLTDFILKILIFVVHN
jgi:hypothetical protein